MYRPHHSNAKSSFPRAPDDPQRSVPSAQPAKDQCQAWAAKTVAHLELANTIRSEGRPRRVVTGTAESSSCLLRPIGLRNLPKTSLAIWPWLLKKIRASLGTASQVKTLHPSTTTMATPRSTGRKRILQKPGEKGNHSPTLPGPRKSQSGGIGSGHHEIWRHQFLQLDI